MGVYRFSSIYFDESNKFETVDKMNDICYYLARRHMNTIIRTPIEETNKTSMPKDVFLLHDALGDEPFMVTGPRFANKKETAEEKTENMELRNVLFTTSSLKSKDNEGYNMILVFMEHYGPNGKHKYNEGFDFIINGTENGNYKLELMDSKKFFAKGEELEDFGEHIKIALKIGNCRATSYDESYSEPVDKENWNIIVKKPVPDFAIEKEYQRIVKELEKGNKNIVSDYQFNEKDIPLVTSVRYCFDVEGLEDDSLSGINKLCYAMTGKYIKNEEEEDREKIRETALDNINKLFSDKLEEMGFNKETTPIFRSSEIVTYSKGNEYICIHSRKDLGSHDGIYIDGKLSSETAKDFDSFVQNLDLIQNKELTPCVLNTDRTKIKTVYNIDSEYVKQLYQNKEEKIKKWICDKFVSKNDNRFVPEDSVCNVEGETVEGNLREMFLHSDMVIPYNAKNSIEEKCLVDDIIKNTYNKLFEENRLEINRDAKGDFYVAVVTPQKDYYVTNNIDSVFIKSPKNEVVMEFNKEDINCNMKINKGFNTWFIPKNFDMKGFIDQNRKDLDLFQKKGEEKLKTNVQTSLGKALNACYEKPKKQKENTEVKIIGKPLTEAQWKLIDAVEKWAEENKVMAKNGKPIQFNRETINPQAHLRMVLKQAKENGFKGNEKDFEQPK